MLHYYRIDNSHNFEMFRSISDTNRHYLRNNFIKVPAYNNRHLSLTLQKPDNVTDHNWGQLYAVRDYVLIPASSLKVSEAREFNTLYVAITEDQVAELDEQLQTKIAAFRIREIEENEKQYALDNLANQIFNDYKNTIENFSKSHPLDGYNRQRAKADNIRIAAFYRCIFDDPENAISRIQAAANDPDKRSAKYWMNNLNPL